MANRISRGCNLAFFRRKKWHLFEKREKRRGERVNAGATEEQLDSKPLYCLSFVLGGPIPSHLLLLLLLLLSAPPSSVYRLSY